MILVKVGQDVVDEDIASPDLIPDVLLLDKQCTVALIPQAICVTLVQVCDHANGDEGDANDEEGEEDRASSEYGLPGRQGLLLEF